MQARFVRSTGLAAVVLLGCSDLGDPYRPGPDCDRSAGGVDFGEVEVGFFTERTITIRNSGNAELEIAVDFSDPNYSVISGAGTFSVGPLASHEVLLRFAPSDTGVHRSELELGNHCPPVKLAGVGGYPAEGPRCVVDPAALNFGVVEATTSVERVIEIRNVGLIAIAVDVRGCAPVFEVVEGGGPGIVERGDTLRVRVRFTPPTSGNFACRLATGTDCGEITLTGAGEMPVTVFYATDIQPIFNNRCVVCHQSPAPPGGLNLAANSSYTELVGVISSGYAPDLRVKAGDPTNSVLYGKIANTGQFGVSMPPPGGGPPVPLAEREKIRIWIVEGARNN